MSRKILFFLSILVLAAPFCALPGASAAQYTIKEMTPQVTSALENRRSRYDQLEALKREGKVGENNRGFAEAFSSESSVKSLVDAENKDRRIIYQTIAEQNELSGALSTIEQVFAQTQRDNAEAGDKIQLQDGRWVVK